MEAKDIAGLAKRHQRERILSSTEADRYWWRKEDRYHVNKEVQMGAGNGELIRLPRTGLGWRLIGRLNGMEDGEPNWLRVEAYWYLRSVCMDWRKKLGSLSEGKFLAVTSLGRTMKTQDKLLAGGDKNRVVRANESSHLAGAAFDVSLRSFYAKNGGGYESVSTWKDRSKFEPRLIEAFIEILEKDERQGICKLTVEDHIDDEGVGVASVGHVCISSDIIYGVD